MTTAEKIVVMQAYEDGKAIECKPQRSSEWKDMSACTPSTPVWNWEICSYRIKPEVQETLEGNIKARWPQYEVVMLDFGETGMLEIQSGIKKYNAHIVAQSMKGFQGFVYIHSDNDWLICNKPTKSNRNKYIQPVAVLFEKGE